MGDRGRVVHVRTSAGASLKATRLSYTELAADRRWTSLAPLDGDDFDGAALAEAIGADKTRIIAILDELQDKGLIERVPDPEDRRARLLAITKAGRRVKDATQAAIQRGEERWLGTLSASDRAAFLRILQELSGVDWS